MEIDFEALIGAGAAFITALVGFWRYLANRFKADGDSRQAMVHLLMGLAQGAIVHQGIEYIDRGWVSTEEYKDLRRYLYEPYVLLGGNGTVERVMHAVERLPFREEPMVKAETYRDIKIRDADETGLPQTKPIPTTESKRGRL